MDILITSMQSPGMNHLPYLKTEGKTRESLPCSLLAVAAAAINKYVLGQTYPSQARTHTNSSPGCGCLTSQMSG